MWLVDLLQKSIPHFSAASHGQEAVDVARVRDIRVRLLKHLTTRPEDIVRATDDELVDALCMLRLDLDALPQDDFLRTDPDSRAVITTISGELDRLLGRDLSFRETHALDDALERLTETAGAQARGRARRKRNTRTLTLLITVLPLLGYGAHWTIANYFHQALMDDADIVYPQNAFELVDERYRLREAVRVDSLRAFRDYYFRQTVRWWGEHNPLPLAFRAKSAAEFGIELSPDIKARIERGAIDPGDIGTNLFVFRVFVRNIRDSNIVNRFQVRAVPSAGKAFPWREMDLDTKIRFAPEMQLFDGGVTVRVDTTRTPVLNMNIGMRLKSTSGDVGKEFRKQLDVLASNRTLSPDWGARLLGGAPDQPVFVRLSPQRAAAVTLDRARRRTVEQAQRQYERNRLTLAKDGYLFFACRDRGVVVLARPKTLQRMLGLEAVDAIEISYTYERLDGIEKSEDQRIALKQPTLHLHDGMSTRYQELEECVQHLALLWAMPAPAAGPGGWVKMLDKVALMLAGKTEQKAPVIAAEEMLIFDFEGKRQELKQGRNRIHILKDGEYVLFTVVATNFRGGDYRFVFYFDEEPVAELKAVLEWPESLRFKARDKALFRPRSDAALANK